MIDNDCFNVDDLIKELNQNTIKDMDDQESVNYESYGDDDYVDYFCCGAARH